MEIIINGVTLQGDFMDANFVGPYEEATYKMQTRETLDKKKLEADLGDLTDYTKITSYPVLRIK